MVVKAKTCRVCGESTKGCVRVCSCKGKRAVVHPECLISKEVWWFPMIPVRARCKVCHDQFDISRHCTAGLRKCDRHIVEGFFSLAVFSLVYMVVFSAFYWVRGTTPVPPASYFVPNVLMHVGIGAIFGSGTLWKTAVRVSVAWTAISISCTLMLMAIIWGYHVTITNAKVGDMSAYFLRFLMMFAVDGFMHWVLPFRSQLWRAVRVYRAHSIRVHAV